MLTGYLDSIKGGNEHVKSSSCWNGWLQIYG
jgi:hypothetical protein